MFHRRLKNINNFRIVDLGPRPMTPENLHFTKKTIDQWNFCCISKNTNAGLQLFSTALNWGLACARTKWRSGEGRVKTGDSFRSLTADRLICVLDFDVRDLGCLETSDLENTDLRPQTSKTQTSKTQTSKTQTPRKLRYIMVTIRSFSYQFRSYLALIHSTGSSGDPRRTASLWNFESLRTRLLRLGNTFDLQI